MCELLDERKRTDRYLLQLYRPRQRGGRTGPHKDGWGITFYEGNGCRTFAIRSRALNSPIARPGAGLPDQVLCGGVPYSPPTAAKWRWKTPTRSPANCGAATGPTRTTAN